MAFIKALQTRSERYHMQTHVIIGFLCGLIVHVYYPEVSAAKLITLGILGNLIPDIDHFLFLFWYGSKTAYAKTVKKYLRSRELKNALMFIRSNHKLNTGIYSHNVFSVLIAFLIFWYLGEKRESAGITVFFLSWCMHYIYDIAEDILFFKRLNPNWFLKFNRWSDKLKEPESLNNK